MGGLLSFDNLEALRDLGQLDAVLDEMIQSCEYIFGESLLLKLGKDSRNRQECLVVEGSSQALR